MKTIKETLQSLLERYKIYAGEYKKPDDLVLEIGLSSALTKEQVNSFTMDTNLITDFNEFWYLIAEIFELFENNYQKQEFLIHKDCFHPSFDLYYACPDTTSAEFVYVIQECLNSL